jgi:hypothetical protein
MTLTTWPIPVWFWSFHNYTDGVFYLLNKVFALWFGSIGLIFAKLQALCLRHILSFSCLKIAGRFSMHQHQWKCTMCHDEKQHNHKNNTGVCGCPILWRAIEKYQSTTKDKEWMWEHQLAFFKPLPALPCCCDAWLYWCDTSCCPKNNHTGVDPLPLGTYKLDFNFLALLFGFSLMCKAVCIMKDGCHLLSIAYNISNLWFMFQDVVTVGLLVSTIELVEECININRGLHPKIFWEGLSVPPTLSWVQQGIFYWGRSQRRPHRSNWKVSAPERALRRFFASLKVEYRLTHWNCARI